MNEAASLQTLASVRPAEPVLGLRILAHPDLSRVGAPCAPLLEGELSRLTPQFADGPLATLHVSRTPVAISVQRDQLTLDAPEHARLTVEGTPLVGARTFDAETLNAGVVLTLGRAVALWLGRFEQGAAPRLPGFVGVSAAASTLKRKLAQLAPESVPVLLLGPPGSGKRAAASVLLALGPAGSYLEDPGALELAPGRVIMGCTHEPPAALRARFAEVLQLTSLHQRREDIAPLFAHFVGQALERVGAPERFRAQGDEQAFVPAALMARLVRAPWPDNARQLRSFADAYVSANHGQQRVELARWMSALPTFRARDLSAADITAALAATNRDTARAALRVGVSRRSLVHRMRKLGVPEADSE